MAPKSKVGLFAALRRDSQSEGLGVRALARKYEVHRRLVREALASAWPAFDVESVAGRQPGRSRTDRPMSWVATEMSSAADCP